MFRLKIFILQFKLIRIIYYWLFNFNLKFKDFSQLNKDSLFIDIGANIGKITQYVDDKFNCNIICYEPNIACFKYLKKRFKNRKNIKIYNYAISNKEGKAKLFLHKQPKEKEDLQYSEAGSLFEKKDNISQTKFLNVKTIDIKNLLKNFKKIDLIKIDIEGYEYNIINDLIQNKLKIKKIVCELHGNPNIKSKKDSTIKNPSLTNDYVSLKKMLQKKNLYVNWFVEWN